MVPLSVPVKVVIRAPFRVLLGSGPHRLRAEGRILKTVVKGLKYRDQGLRLWD